MIVMAGIVNARTLRMSAQGAINQCNAHLQDMLLIYDNYPNAITSRPFVKDLFEEEITELRESINGLDQHLRLLPNGHKANAPEFRDLSKLVRQIQAYLKYDGYFHPLKLVSPAEELYEYLSHVDDQSLREEITRVTDSMLEIAERSKGIIVSSFNREDIRGRIDTLKRAAQSQPVILASELQLVSTITQKKLHEVSMIVEKILAYVFGIVFIMAMLVLAIAFPNPTPFQYTVFRIILALACAGVAAVLPGMLNVKFGNVARATGALGIFLIVYFYSPAQLVTQT